MGYVNAPTLLTGLNVAGVPTMGMGGLPLTTGQVFFCDGLNGSAGGDGSASAPYQTIYQAYNACVSGRGDIVVIVSNGLTTASQRLSLANAQAVTPAATTGTLVWAKNNTHLIGATSPTMFASRARLAPPTGTYTAATFNADIFVSVTASGCIFANFSTFCGFSTGSASMVSWKDTGGRNYYSRVQFGGFGDAASADGTGARTIVVGAAGSGENTFDQCVFGLDTASSPRSVANATLEFAGGSPRNVFNDCIFPMQADNAGVLSILGTGNSCVDRINYFNRCKFVNGMSSGGVAQTVIASFTTASPGGLLLMDQCTLLGDTSTNWGDTNALANMYVNGGSPTAATNGIAIKPT